MASKRELAKLTVTLEAQNQQYIRQLNTANKKIKGFERKQKKAIFAVRNAWRQFGAGIGVVGLGATAIQVGRLTDQFTGYNIRIKTATKDTGDFAAVQAKLTSSAIRTGAEMGAVVSVFQAFSRSRTELGATNDQLLQITDTINKLGVISGATNESVKNGLRQLSQAFASDIFRAEEYNSAVENIPEVVARVAIEMGKTQGQLRQMVVDGKLFSKDFAQALLDASGKVNEDFGNILPTMARGFAAITTATGAWLAKLDESLGITRSIGSQLQEWADLIDPAQANIEQLEIELERFNKLAKAGFSEGLLKSNVIKLRKEIVAMSEQWVITAGNQEDILKIMREYDKVLKESASGGFALEQAIKRVAAIEFGDSTLDESTLGKVNKQIDTLIGKWQKQNEAFVTSKIESEFLLALMKDMTDQQELALQVEYEIRKAQIDQEAATKKAAETEKDRLATVKALEKAYAGIVKGLRTASEIVEGDFAEAMAILNGQEKTPDRDKTQARLEANFAEAKRAIAAGLGSAFTLEDLQEELMTQEEIIRRSMKRRVDMVNATEGAVVGGISPEHAAELRAKLAKSLDKQLEDLDSTLNTMTELQQHAAEQMQDAFAEFLFDPFSKGLDGMLLAFIETLHKMVAEIAAAQLFEGLKGKAGGGGILGFVGGFLSGARAGGGPVIGGKSYLVGENGPEIHTPKGSGSITPNHKMGGLEIINYNTFQTDSGNAALIASQIESSRLQTISDIRNLSGKGRF